MSKTDGPHGLDDVSITAYVYIGVIAIPSRYNEHMNKPARMLRDKTTFSVVSLSEADDDKSYWQSKSAQERLQAVELMLLARQKVMCQPHLGAGSTRRQQVRVGQLVVAAAKVVGLDPTLVYQRAQAVVDLAHTHAQAGRQPTLAHGRLVGDLAQEFVLAGHASDEGNFWSVGLGHGAAVRRGRRCLCNAHATA